MTYDESGALMDDLAFRKRIKVALLTYSTYIQNEAPSTAGHSARYRWAQQAAAAPDTEAGRIQPMVVMDGQVQADGAAITDANLQASVEIVVNRFV